MLGAAVPRSKARHGSRSDAKGLNPKPPRSAPSSPKLSPKDPLEFARYAAVSFKPPSVSIRMSAWGSVSSPSHFADHLPSSLALPAAVCRTPGSAKKREDKETTDRIRSGPKLDNRKKQVDDMAYDALVSVQVCCCNFHCSYWVVAINKLDASAAEFSC